ncbi:hypothetical protein AVEN_55818-1 [Araneus ventricosus]|uniref:Uncharacterized protein n=1 Tax=Araneus ventricosus TaxID=182803 RepID=A0A4Y2CMS4_ARAVE|nr:hypothetical protein AVEN_55818-1 [Araneus ventricosus]
MRGEYSQAANKHMMMIGSSVDYVRSGGMRNVPVTKAVEHLYATTAKFSGCVLLPATSAIHYSQPPYPSHEELILSNKEAYRRNISQTFSHLEAPQICGYKKPPDKVSSRSWSWVQ